MPSSLHLPWPRTYIWPHCRSMSAWHSQTCRPTCNYTVPLYQLNLNKILPSQSHHSHPSLISTDRCWLKSKLTVHKQIYENIKRKVTDLVDNAKTAFYSFKIQTSNSCKELFHNFNAILGKKNSTPLPSSLDSDDIPQAFSEYFTNKIITIRNSFPPLNPTVAMDKTTYSRNFLQTFTPVTEQFVSEILQKTVPKSCDLDPIPTELLSENLDVFLPAIINIIKTSLASGFVLPDCKTAIVKPLLQKTSVDQNVLKNYRPISNLPFLSKFLKKVVLHKLLAHLQENNHCNPFQSTRPPSYAL